MKVYGRVSVEFDVNEELFKKDPQAAIDQAIEEGKAFANDDDSYLPEPWNEDVITEDITIDTGKLNLTKA